MSDSNNEYNQTTIDTLVNLEIKMIEDNSLKLEAHEV